MIKLIKYDFKMAPIQELSNNLLYYLGNENADSWKVPELFEICKLAVECLTLDGLEDSTRASQIRFLISELAEKI